MCPATASRSTKAMVKDLVMLATEYRSAAWTVGVPWCASPVQTVPLLPTATAMLETAGWDATHRLRAAWSAAAREGVVVVVFSAAAGCRGAGVGFVFMTGAAVVEVVEGVVDGGVGVAKAASLRASR